MINFKGAIGMGGPMPGDIDIVAELEEAVIKVLNKHGITRCQQTQLLVSISMLQLSVGWASDGDGDMEILGEIFQGLVSGSKSYHELATLLAKFAGVTMLVEDLRAGVDLPAKDRPS